MQVAESSGDDAKTATSLRYSALLKQIRGDLSGAAGDLERVLALRQKTLGPDDPSVADELIALAELGMQQGKRPDAARLLLAAQRIRESAFGAESVEVAEVLLERAALLLQQGELSAAEEIGRRALAVDEKVLGAEDVENAYAALQLANICSAEGHTQEAERLYLRALRLHEGLMGGDDPVLIPILTSFAALRQKEGRYDDAATLSLRATNIREAALGAGPESERVKHWRALIGRSFVNYNLGEFGTEIEIAKQAVRYTEARFGPEDFRVSAFVMILARQYCNGQAAFTKAEPLLRRAIRMVEKTLGTEEPGLAEIYTSYARCATSELKPGKAEHLYLRAMNIQSRMMNMQVSEDPYLTSPRLELADLYLQQGRIEEAQQLLQDALRKREITGGPEAPSAVAISKILRTLAQVFRREGRFADATTLMERAIKYDGMAWGFGWAVLRRSYQASDMAQLGDIYADERKYSEAVATYRQALKVNSHTSRTHSEVENPNTGTRWRLALVLILQGNYPAAESIFSEDLHAEVASNHPATADNARRWLALAYIQQGRYADAEPLLEASLQAEQSTTDPNSPVLAETLFRLGMNNFALNREPSAAGYFDRSFAILQHQLQYYFSYMSEKDRLQVLSVVSYRFPAFFSFVERFHEEDRQLTKRMYDLLLWQKGLVARSIESVRQRVYESGNAEALGLLDQLAAMRAQLSSMIADTATSTDAAQKKRNALQLEIEDMERKLVERSQSFAALQQEQQHVHWEEVRNKLSPVGEASVEFVRFAFHDGTRWTNSAHYAALAITPNSATPSFVALGDAAILEKKPVADYRRWVSRPDANAGFAPPPFTFYEAFWRPLERYLGAARRVYVAPDGVLNQTSLAVVPVTEVALLSDKFDIRILNSTADLLQGAVTASAKTAALVGDPAFSISEQEQAAALNSLKHLTTTSPIEVTRSGMPKDLKDRYFGNINRSGIDSSNNEQNCEKQTLPALAGTRREVNEIYYTLQSNGWSVPAPYTGARALEEAVKKLQHPRVLHIATHGFFFADEQGRGSSTNPAAVTADPMLRSGLFLAGASRTLCGRAAPSGIEDGVLTAYEASTIDLQGTELVVLSACETGLGENRAGEGVFGLRRALQEAGVRAVLISMWRVPDGATSELMERFYKHWLSTGDKHEALRLAEQELRSQPGRDAPYYWGGFVLVGQ